MNPIDVLLLGLTVVVFTLYLWSPTAPLVLAVPASFWVARLGGGGSQNNLSYSDALLAIALLASLPMLRWSRARQMKRMMTLVAVYQVTTLFSVLAHPNRYDIVEWFHQLLMVAGSMIVGYVIVERGKAKQALGLYLVVASGFAAYISVSFVIHGFHGLGGLPEGLQKNLLGDLFAVAVLIAQYKPEWVGLQGGWVSASKYICVAGVIGSQSRNAMISLVVAVGVLTLRDMRLGERPRLLLAGMIPLIGVAYFSLRSQVLSHTSTNSFYYRETSYRQTLAIWQQSPIFGVGERFWYIPHYHAIQPPNAEISMLATGGIVGLIGFMVLAIGALWLLWRLPKVAGTMAFAVLLDHFISGQFDIFWTTASGSLPWIIAGMALSTSATLDREETEPPIISATPFRQSERPSIAGTE